MRETLVERRRRILRAEIGAVAIRLFAERGFDAVTINDIAEAAGTSPRTFFRYFKTKDDVVLDYERYLLDRLAMALDERPLAEGPVTALREAFVATSHVEVSDRARILELGRILDATPALQGRTHSYRIVGSAPLVAAIATRMGVDGDDPRPRATVAAMTAVAAAEFRAWVVEEGRGDPADRIGAALTLVEGGLTALDRATPETEPLRGEERSGHEDP
jgi:AcrR family transcriptional regulator